MTAICQKDYCDKVFCAGFPCHWIPKSGTKLSLTNTVTGGDPCAVEMNLCWQTLKTVGTCGGAPAFASGWIAIQSFGDCEYAFMVNGSTGPPTSCDPPGSEDCHCGCAFSLSIYKQCPDENTWVGIGTAPLALTTIRDPTGFAHASTGPGAISGIWSECGCAGAGPDEAEFIFPNVANGTQHCYPGCECCNKESILTYCYACHPLSKTLYVSGVARSGFSSTPMSWVDDVRTVPPVSGGGVQFGDCTGFDVGNYGAWVSDVVTDGDGNPAQIAFRCCHLCGVGDSQESDCVSGTNGCRCGCGWILQHSSGPTAFTSERHSDGTNLVVNLNCEPMVLLTGIVAGVGAFTVAE